MATILSDAAKFIKPAATAGVAGVVVTEIFEITVPAGVTGSDIIEIGYLPAGNRIVAAEIIGSGTGSATVEVGLMTGAMGDAAGSRALASGTKLFAAATAVSNATATAAIATCLAQPKSDKDVGIGVVPSAALTAGGKLTLVLSYRA